MTIASDSSGSAASVGALAVPRYIRNLNAIAERAGMTVTMRAASVPEQPEPNLMARWEGTLEQLAATGLLVPHTVRRLRWASASSTHASGARCQLSGLSGDVSGEARVSGDRIVWEINWGPIDYSIEQRGEVEIVTHSCEIVYHGSAAALEGAGIPRKRLPTGKHTAKSRYGILEGPEPAWRARRQPDESYVYYREAEDLVRIRCEREAERRRRQQPDQRSSSEPRSPGLQSAADWKQAECTSWANWIRAAVISIERGSSPARFRLEEAALQRIRAVADRFSREMLAEIGEGRVIDAQAPRHGLRLVWAAPRR